MNKTRAFSKKEIQKCNPKIPAKRLKKYYERAKKLLCNEKKMEDFLCSLEEKLKKIPKLGNKLAYAPTFASLLNNYLHKTYTTIPLGTIIALLASLVYLVSPFDALPDCIFGIGYLDDASIIAGCATLIKSDIDDYQCWRKKQKNVSTTK